MQADEARQRKKASRPHQGAVVESAQSKGVNK